MQGNTEVAGENAQAGAPMSVLLIDDDRELCRMLAEYPVSYTHLHHRVDPIHALVTPGRNIGDHAAALPAISMLVGQLELCDCTLVRRLNVRFALPVAVLACLLYTSRCV